MQKAKEQQNLESVRVALQREFLDRCKRNSSYSLRAYANYLEIDQSFLSKLLKGQRRITSELAENIGSKIGLQPKQLAEIFSSGTAGMPGFLTLSEDEFELLSDWRHFAILELCKTKNFVADEQFVATRLNIHIEEVRAAVQRLERAGFLKITDKKWKVLVSDTTWSNTKKTSHARRMYQRSLIEKGLDAIDHVPFELRENGSMTVAINKSRLPEFKEKLKQMRKELADFFQADGEEDLDEVFQLTVALFPLTKIKEVNNK